MLQRVIRGLSSVWVNIFYAEGGPLGKYLVVHNVSRVVGSEAEFSSVQDEDEGTQT